MGPVLQGTEHGSPRRPRSCVTLLPRGFRRTGKVIPYVTAGYSMLFDSLDDSLNDRLNAFNVGGGVNYWFARRAGLRLELRDHIHSVDGRRSLVGLPVRHHLPVRDDVREHARRRC